MSFGTRMMARVSETAARIAAARIDEIAAAAMDAGGILVRREGRRLRLSGRDLVRRYWSEPLLRFAGWRR